MNTLTFNNKPLQVIERNNQIWLTSVELAKALNYKSTKSVTNIFNSNSDEFTTSMSMVIESVTNGINNSVRKKQVRIFSLRGCHLIAILSRTEIAKMFRKWVLDILDKESNTIEVKPITAIIPHEGRWNVRYLDGEVMIKNIDGKVCIDNELFRQLQKDSVFYRNQLQDLSEKLKNMLAFTVSYAEKTRVTSGECSENVLSEPLANLIA